MGKPNAPPYSSEEAGADLADRLIAHIVKKKGQYLRDRDGSLHVIIEGRRVPINDRRDNLALARLILKAGGVSTLSFSSRIAIQRLRVHADEKAGHLKMGRFSALSDDGKRLYIPRDDGSLLLVTDGETLMTDRNGDNEDGLWVEHPNDKPFGWSTEDPQIGLAHFERLLVENQACVEPTMQWFLAMHEGLFPFVRDLSPARLTLIHVGGSQSGKTTGAQRFTLLHGLGEVKGDFSVAALRSLGDIGLLSMDNKEQGDLSPGYINFLLFLSTGAAYGRCHDDGRMRPTDSGRPIGVVTTIEGIAVKPVLRNRCVEVQYEKKYPKLARGPIEREIVALRNPINSALAEVLRRFFQLRNERVVSSPNPVPDFEEHTAILCDLLRAFAWVSDKPANWAEDIIESWNKILGEREAEEDTLERPLLRIFRELKPDDPDIVQTPVHYRGKAGTLYVTECGALLSKLQELNLPGGIKLPSNATGLGRRLWSTHFVLFQVLDADRAPELDALKRTANRRPIGFFRPNDKDDDRTV